MSATTEEMVETIGRKMSKQFRMEEEDAIQEAWVVFLKCASKYSGANNAQFTTYFTRCCRNHFLNLKRADTSVVADSVDFFDSTADDIAAATDFIAVDSPEDSLSKLEELEVFLDKLQTLEEETRNIINMRINEERPFAEIARELKKTVSAVKVKLHRAVVALRKDLMGA